jgi:hypothetical protein
VIVADSTKRGTAAPNQQVFPYNHYGSFANSYGRAAVNSNYSGAVAVVKYHGVHGIVAQGSYTWSHSLDYSSAFFGSTGDFGFPSNGNNLKAEYGNSSFDMRHRFVGYYTIPLPFGPGQKFLTSKNIVSREAVEGWTDNKSPAAAFDTTYFSTITAGQVGTERRDQYYGPGLVNFDLAVAKDLPLSERFRLNFRADLFNLFNHTNFSNPIATYTSSSFGKITSTVGNATSGTGGAIGGARLAQFALRLNF